MTVDLYEDPALDLLWIETPPTTQTWLPGDPVIPGSVWCWAHWDWERIPTAGRAERGHITVPSQPPHAPA